MLVLLGIKILFAKSFQLIGRWAADFRVRVNKISAGRRRKTLMVIGLGFVMIASSITCTVFRKIVVDLHEHGVNSTSALISSEFIHIIQLIFY